MEYMMCYPGTDNMTREKNDKVHNILARMSEKYKLKIVPEPMKNTAFRGGDFCRKFRIYKKLREREGNGEAYLDREEEEMLLSVCRDEEEKQIMKNCVYAYQYSSGLVLKAFREKDRKR